MKKIFVILLVAAMSAACCKTPQPTPWEFDFSKSLLCDGTWSTAYYILPSGSYALCSSPEHVYGEYRFTIKFNEDGTYRSTGYLGDNSGTYVARGKTVEASVDSRSSLNIVFSGASETDATITIVMSPGGRVGSWYIVKQKTVE